MKKMNDKMGYAIGTILSAVILIILSLGLIGLVGLGVLKIWMYFIETFQAIFQAVFRWISGK